jgi:hypothetical protein
LLFPSSSTQNDLIESGFVYPQTFLTPLHLQADIAQATQKQKAIFGSVFSKPVYQDVPDVKFWDGPLPRV